MVLSTRVALQACVSEQACVRVVFCVRLCDVCQREWGEGQVRTASSPKQHTTSARTEKTCARVRAKDTGSASSFLRLKNCPFLHPHPYPSPPPPSPLQPVCVLMLVSLPPSVCLSLLHLLFSPAAWSALARQNVVSTFLLPHSAGCSRAAPHLVCRPPHELGTLCNVLCHATALNKQQPVLPPHRRKGLGQTARKRDSERG